SMDPRIHYTCSLIQHFNIFVVVWISRSASRSLYLVAMVSIIHSACSFSFTINIRFIIFSPIVLVHVVLVSLSLLQLSCTIRCLVVHLLINNDLIAVFAVDACRDELQKCCRQPAAISQDLVPLGLLCDGLEVLVAIKRFVG